MKERLKDMTNKKSFILYTDQREVVDSLTNEQAGILFKTIFQYHSEEPYILDALLNIAFIPFKQTFRRDEEKWSEIKEKRAEAGRIGGLNKAKNLANVANASFAKQKLANVAVSVSDSVSVSVSNDISKDISRKSETPIKSNKLVNKVIDEFEEALGFKPTDRKPRYQAYNLVRRLQSIIKTNGKEATEEVSLKAINSYFKWLKNQDWFVMVQTLDTCRRKTDIFVHDYNLK